MGEAKFRTIDLGPPTQQPVKEGGILPMGGPGTLRDAYEHERRRATMLEQVVIDQLAAIGLLLAEHTRQIAALEGKAKPKSSIIKLVN